jgi:S-(hydroxymethyl)glutathione dehydrogenase/alcohol dehydrogenase
MSHMSFNAAVLTEAGHALAIERLTLGALGEHDVVVAVRATSLCHTDLEAVRGDLGVPLPFVPGHEAAGVVQWVGKAVTHLVVGDHVITSWNPHCNGCFFCMRQQSILCRQYRDHSAAAWHFDGHPRLFLGEQPVRQLMYSGSFAELCVVTADCAVTIHKEMPFDRACLIGCGVMTGVGAVLNVAKVEAGSSVCVIGCGAVGLSAVQGARLAGAQRIIAVERDPLKLELAKTFGATDTLIADENLNDALAELTSGRGADYVFEAAGNPAAFRASLELVRVGGSVVWLGKLPAQQDMAFRWGTLMGEKRIVRASYGGAVPERDFPMLVDAYFNGTLLLDEYVTARISLADVNVGLDRLARGVDIRSVIEF